MLKAARDSLQAGVIAIVQPHRFTRLRDIFADFAACFNDADTVVLVPVYSAGEEPIEGVTSETLVERIRSVGIVMCVMSQAVRSCGLVSRNRQAGRLCHLPWRGQHHAMGLCAAQGMNA